MQHSDLDSLDEDFPNLDPEERAHIVKLLSNHPLRSPERPTIARPGTKGRVAVYEERFAAGQAIFHPGDSSLRHVSDDIVYTAPVLGNGALGEKSEALADREADLAAKAAEAARERRSILPLRRKADPCT